MIYIFTYKLGDYYNTHVCNTEKEANSFFNMLLAIKVEYMRIVTKYDRFGGYNA